MRQDVVRWNGTGARGGTVPLDLARARAAAVRQLATWGMLTATALAALGLAGCGDGQAGREAPARPASSGSTGSSGGEVAVPGMTASVPDSAPLPGRAGSGTAAVGNANGSISTPGEGTLQSGDPTDASVRTLIDAINASEIEASQLALQKGQRAEVRRYAQSMVATHRQGSMDRAIEAAGTNSANDLLLPLRDQHVKTMQLLQKLPNGPAFDRAYITAQVQAHEGALQSLERAETAVKNATLTDQVRRMQGEVEKHLAEARRVQALVQANTGT